MSRNIEIKARSRDHDAERRVADALQDGGCAVIHQEDTFFNVPTGRLKLREFGDGTAELIQYERPDSSGPKLSSYIRTPVEEPARLKQALSNALGVRAVIRKVRQLFLAGQTRIHLDEVEGLGNFIELEVVLMPGQTEADGERIARELMRKLGIAETQLLTGAYVDMLDG